MVAAVEKKVETTKSWWAANQYSQITVLPHSDGEAYVAISGAGFIQGVFIPLDICEFIGQRAAEIKAANGGG